MKTNIPISMSKTKDGELYRHTKKRLKQLSVIKYDGVPYADTWDLCNAVGIDRNIFIWLYLQSDMSLDTVIKLAQEIENI